MRADDLALDTNPHCGSPGALDLWQVARVLLRCFWNFVLLRLFKAAIYLPKDQ